ncbi:four-carbon acid sugar kinase family protein [Dongia sp.]|uniref:four-carbon acid sugar kinase family protein n=1 Tax=Dongia sp. TaxID=1977262 RepID=UPI003750833B
MSSAAKTNRAYDLAYYGDDFTGSTDVLDVLVRAGIPTVLLLRDPTPELLDRFPEARAVGVAGMSRSKSPDWMDEALSPLFAKLRDLGAPFVHYKVCSTFDSSPSVGSIGRAIDCAATVFRNRAVPLVVGAPALKRYTTFGNLFATVGDVTYRIDRHPTMARHPVTPMDEADLRLHLGKQTARKIGLVDILAVNAGTGLASFEAELAAGAEIVLIDVLDAESSREAGRVIAASAEPVQFLAGSSGVEYALCAYWESIGRIVRPAALPELRANGPLLVVSGSCSPVTSGQIAAARAQGFETIALDPVKLLEGQAETHRAARAAEAVLGRGQSVVVYSAEAPDPSAVKALQARAGTEVLNEKIGVALATVVSSAREPGLIRRAVIAGGDTSGAVAQAMRLEALTMIAPTVPGAPLCRATAETDVVDGIEVVFKGGQIGGPDYFIGLRDGAA